MPAENISFQKNLLTWYQKNARKLPWRDTKDPYSIWVSEIMLQQTQVQTVIPYYKRWLERFPTVQDLAAAPLPDVLKYWAGLGYYRRARMLHEGAKTVVEQFKGVLPNTPEALLKIPGIGRYTAGAIASIAFENKTPVLDGNVIRILTRIHTIKDDAGSPKTIAALWDLAGSLLPEKSFGDFNQALMELGATVCFPKNPACTVCPVISSCKAAGKNPERYPVKHKKEIMESLETASLLLKQKGKYLVRRQPETGRWGGLWMFPHWPDKNTMLESTGLKEKQLTPRLTVKHGFTKYRINLNVYETENRIRKNGLKVSDSAESSERWCSPKELKELAMPSPHQKIVRELFS